MGKIDIYDRRSMLQAVRQMMPTNTFLKDLFFADTKTFDTEAVDVDYYKGRRKMAPFVSPRLPGTVVERSGFTTKSFKAPLIKPKRILTADDLKKRSMGENVYSSKSPDERATEMLADDLIELDDQITRREEWMAAQVLFTGQVHMVGDGVDAILDYDFTNKVALTGTDKWSDPASKKYRWLKSTRLAIIQKSGITPDTVLMASDVVDSFIEDLEIQKMMDIRNVEMGKINPKALPNGVTYIGTLTALGLDIYSYDEWYFDEETGTEKAMVPPGHLLMGSTRSKSSMLYGAVTLIDPVSKSFVTYEGSRIPHTWVSEDPPSRTIQINSRPLPVPHEVDSWYVAQVL